ncbi:hypothetical protein [Phycicoccus jejuensis]|uniref:hypothetical protein n=1 Tax=Phycicoccus jejuensis TaxID=367299 RepID=UPI000A0295CE|nr:hypothetical protein [Phycicoccus jejuensis]
MTTTHHPSAARVPTDRPHRGIQHLLHPQVLGVIIGGSGASAFVHVNKDLLPGSWPTVAVLAWAAAVFVCAWAVLLRPRRLRDVGPPRPGAGLVYSASVLGMLAGFAIGRFVLDAAGRPELMPAVVVVAVGLHFVPFARAFGAPVFGTLGWSLAAIGVVGVLLGLVAGTVPVAAAAVVTGVVMLLLMALDAVRPGAPS